MPVEELEASFRSGLPNLKHLILTNTLVDGDIGSVSGLDSLVRSGARAVSAWRPNRRIELHEPM